MQTTPVTRRPVLAALSLSLLAACQTPSAGTYSGEPERQDELAQTLKAEFCRGQEPAPVDVLEVVYDGWPREARRYVEGNVCQYAAQCDRPYYEAECGPAR